MLLSPVLQKRFFLLIILLLLSNVSKAEQPHEVLFLQAGEKYEQGDYEEAIKDLLKALEMSPNQSDYHHLLGKAYGRVAENASWLKALSYARKTRASFEKAVQLNEENINALKDLMEFYRCAPGFLGGSDKKAGEIESRLMELENASQDRILQN